MEDECHMRFKYGEMLTFGETLTPNAEVENALLCDGDYSEVRLRDNKFDHGRKLCYGDTLSDSRTAQGTPNAEVEDALLCDGDYSRFHPWENTFDHGRKPCFGDTLSDGRTAQEAQKSDFEGGLGSLRSQSTRLSPSLLTSQSHSECSSSDSEPKILSGDEKKHLLLGRLMDYFYELFSWCHTPELAVDAAIPNAEVEENSDSVNSPTACILNNGKPSPKAHAVGGKRPRNGERDDEDDAGEENLPAKRKTLPGDATTILRKLACPYFKNDPEHCQAGRSCSGPGWATVHRMK
jgi:hypothetical protein